MKVGKALHDMGMMHTTTYKRDCALLPWKWGAIWKRNKEARDSMITRKNSKKGSSEGSDTKKNDCKKTNGRKEIDEFITSKKFKRFIRAKKKLSMEDDVDPNVDIQKHEPKYTSVDLLSHFIGNNIDVTIVTGDLDHVYPFEGVENAFNMVRFDYEEEFRNADWVKNGSNTYQKSVKNVKWIRHTKAGHNLYMDHQNWLAKMVLNSVYETEERTQSELEKRWT